MYSKVQRLIGTKRPLSIPPEELVASYAEAIFESSGIMADGIQNVQNAAQMQQGGAPSQMQQVQPNAMQQQQMMYGGAGNQPGVRYIRICYLPWTK